MNPSSDCMNSFIHRKSMITLLLGIILLLPIVATAQEVTEEPQVTPVVTVEAVEESTPVEETVAPTEAPVETEQPVVEETPAPTEEPVVETEQPATEAVVTEEATATETDVPVEQETVPAESTEEVLSEATEEPTVEPVETEAVEATPVPETVEAVVIPAEITTISEDFEAFTGENWTLADWSVAPVDDSLALVSTIASASAELISLDWTSYTVSVDVKVEADNSLALNFDGYNLVIASDGSHQLLKDGEVVAEPAVPLIIDPEAEATDPVWHTVTINKTETATTILIDDVPQYGYQTEISPLGIFAFVAGGEQGVAIDNLAMAEVEVQEVVAETPTPEVVIEAETTEEPIAEATEEVLAESTEEPMVEATEEPVAEATQEVVAVVEETPAFTVTNLITEDFETDLTAWTTSASIVEVAEGNHVLLMGNGGQLAPVSGTVTDNLIISGEASIVSDGDVAGSFTVVLDGAYAVEISTTGVTISNNGEILSVVESAQAVSTWFSFAITADSAGISVSTNDVVIAEYAGEMVVNGGFAVTTNTSTMLDNLSVDTLTIEEIIEPLATPAPEVTNTEVLSVMGGIAYDVMSAYLDGGDEAVTALLAESSDPQDESGRVLVDILVNDGFTGDAIGLIVTEAGGDVTRVYDKSLEAYVNVSVLMALGNHEGVKFVRDVTRAVSTGPTAPVGTNGSDATWTEAFNMLSIEEWNDAGITGQGVKIGVIDTGFAGADGNRNGNLICQASTTMQYTPDGSGALFDSNVPAIARTHGTNVMEIICDIAPQSDVYMYRADDLASVVGAVNAAMAGDMDVILITLDLGVHTSAGGGESASVDQNLYGLLESAKNSGIVTIVAAGNNNQRILNLAIPTGDSGKTFTIDLGVTNGDKINFGWNDFDEDGIATVSATLTSNTQSDSGSSSNPLLNPLTLDAEETDTTASLSVTVTGITETVYLQIQISPRIISAEGSNPTTIANAENNVKFDYDSLEVNSVSNFTNNISGTTGNLGRPADSDDVISVGASCAVSNAAPDRWEFSSNGPRFDTDGSPLDVAGDGVITQAETKPTLMSYAFVTTRDLSASPEIGPITVNPDGSFTCSNGFGGTSAAAAHVAGMTALLMSNDDNASFDDLNVDNATDSDTFRAIRDYLQARSVDLPLGEDADGFDTIFGSGLAVLGAPSYDLDDAVNLSTEPDLLSETCQLGTTKYVGQGDLDNTLLNGSITSPYTSIAAALAAGEAGDGDFDCIVVMPGEYMTPLVIDNAYTDLLVTGYDDVSRQSVSDVILWLRNMYYTGDQFDGFNKRAAVYFTEQASNIEFSGFTFVVADILKDVDGNPVSTSDVNGVIVDGSSNVTVSNSQFGTISVNGEEYSGWVNLDATPLLVLNEAQGVRIENNIFNDNNVGLNTGFYPTMAIIGSGGDSEVPTVGTPADPTNDDKIVVIGNEIYGNTVYGNTDWEAVLYVKDSAVDIINNAFSHNTGDTIVKIETDNPRDTNSTSYLRRARLVGNVFLGNTTDTAAPSNLISAAGPIISSYYTPFLYIVNNTFVDNTVGDDTNVNFGHFIGRGSIGRTTATGSINDGWNFWEIHNNLFYDNTYRVLVGDTVGIAANTCHRIPNDTTEDALFAWSYIPGPSDRYLTSSDSEGEYNQRGTQNNWIVNNTISDPSGLGVCTIAIGNQSFKNTPTNPSYKNQNIVQTDLQPVDSRSADDIAVEGSLSSDFQGDDPENENFTEDDWQYWALTQTYVHPNDSAFNEFSDGIDAGATRWLTPDGDFIKEGEAGDSNFPYMDGADVTVDIVGTARPLDVIKWVINWDTGISSTTYGYSPAISPVQGVSGTVSETYPVPSISGTQLVDYADLYVLDIGAFEFSPLQFVTNATDGDDDYWDTSAIITVNSVDIQPITLGLTEDALAADSVSDAVFRDNVVTFDINQVVTGGFGNVSFRIVGQPNNYGTHCGAEFLNTKGLVEQDGGFDGFFDYCMPQNYYTDGSDFISFRIEARDEAGASATGELRFTIAAAQDAPFPGDNSLAIGDGNPANDEFEVVGTLGSNLTVRLRPYVRFENFFFSENGNPEFLVGGSKMVDYPFVFEITGIDDPNSIIDLGSSPTVVIGSSYDSASVLGIVLSNANEGVATITYDVRDAFGNELFDNQLKIRSISVIPTEGLFDDTSFVWNYSDGANSKFYTEREGFESTEAPSNGDWQALRQSGAINNTIHTTSTLNDTATFRFVGTGFTLYMRNKTVSNDHFALNIYDDVTTIFSSTENVETWAPVAGSTFVNELKVGSDFSCTTRASIDPLDGQRLLNSLGDYTITCNGLTVRKHTVQVVNTGASELGVDAFAIITDEGSFLDADPLPPGFYDIDNGILRNAFDSGEWGEVAGSAFSSGIALQAISPTTNISFTITEASGFAIGSSYRNTNTSYEICVDDDKVLDPDEGVCQTIEDDIAGKAASNIHHPFFGLDPNTNYTVTLKLDGTNDGLIFDDLVVFDSSMLPADVLSVGTATATNTNMTLGEPFGDDWSTSGDSQVINSGRSPVGPFIAFEFDSDIDGMALSMTNIVPPPYCSAKARKRGQCAPPPPSGLGGLMVCVNRGTQATETADDTGDCITIETLTGTYTSVSGTQSVAILPDDSIFIDQSMFMENWDSSPNTVEIFSLTPDQNLTFSSVRLLSTALGLGAGTYESYSSGIYYVDYTPTETPTYTEVAIDDDPESWITQIIRQCVRFKKGRCIDLRTIGTQIQSSGIGDAFLFKMQGTGFAPNISTETGLQVRACWLPATEVASTDVDEIAEEIQAEAPADSSCWFYSHDGSNHKPGVYGLESDVYWVMVELLPSLTTDPVSLPIEGVSVIDTDWEVLTPISSGRVENSYNSRMADNLFAYSGSWSTVADTSGTHSGTSYDISGGTAGESLLFRTSGVNNVQIIRDLRSTYATMDVCFAKETNASDQTCNTYSNSGNATQVPLSISLPDNGAYVWSITSVSNLKYVIDAIEVIDTTADKMFAGTYQENSSLITYSNGYDAILKNSSFENGSLLDTATGTWTWNIASSVTGTISTERKFIGSKSAKIEADDLETLDSEEFQLIAGDTYTVIARVYVESGTSVDLDILRENNFATQTTKYTGKWELLRYTFVADPTDPTQQLRFTANGSTTFFVDNVMVYRGNGSWQFGSGGLSDGQIATSNGYNATASFHFYGTGFTVKLASDTTSGETQVCYDTNSDMSTASCFTYDDEQLPLPAICYGSGKRRFCSAQSSVVSNGHSATGLSDTASDYYVTVTQMDNGLTVAPGATVCYGSGKRRYCIAGDPPNSGNNGPTSVKLDYVTIYENALPPVLEAGGYNEDGLSGNEAGLQLFPPMEWSQIVGNNASGYSGNSFYEVNDDVALGSLLALQVENDEPTTIVVDINSVSPSADQMLACIDQIDGGIEFNGTDYDLTSANCVITDQAVTQTQMVFNVNNLPLLDGLGTPRLFTLRSLNRDNVKIDGYQVIHGTRLTEGFYQDTLGHGESGAIFTISNISGSTDDWSTFSSTAYNGNTALGTSIDGTTVMLEFEGTGFSLIPSTGQPVTVCTAYNKGRCIATGLKPPPVGQLAIDLDTAIDDLGVSGDGFDICTGSCEEEIGTISNIDVNSGPITVAGLPYGVYTVTITSQLDAGEEVSFDALEIYGSLQELGSLYDDAQVNISGTQLLKFGPITANWEAVEGAGSNFLNKTYHQTLNAGSTVSFNVGAEYQTQAIIIYDGNPTLPPPVCTRVGKRTYCSGPGYSVPSTSQLEVCWSSVSGTLSRSCETVTNLDDGLVSRRVNAPEAGTYSVSITNKANNQPLVIDAIQIIEEGLVTEGIYEEDYFINGTDGSFTSPVANTDASNDSVMQLDLDDYLTFTFDGVAFSVNVVESASTSTDYDICALAGDIAALTDCSTVAANELFDNITGTSNNSLSALSYAGFTQTGAENADGRWTVVIKNNVSAPLYIDRIDVLSNNNNLFIDDTETYEAGDPELRYLPFGSWVENKSFKNGTPYNGNQFETTLPGSITYFEFGDGTFGIEYVRQIQQFIPQSAVCVRFKKSTCIQYSTIPAVPAFADADICYGALGDPDLDNMTCMSVENGLADLFQFGSSTASVDCSSGCWGYVSYGRDSAGNSKTTLDFVRLYDPAATLSAGVYQENHPSLMYSITATAVADTNAKVGFYNQIDNVGSAEYVAFPFSGTGFSVRTVGNDSADDISLCVYDYTGEGSIPNPATVMGSANCLRTYDQEFEDPTYVERALHGLHHGADYLAIVKMSDDGNDLTTQFNIDQITIFDQQWFTETDLDDATYLNELLGGEEYPIDYQTRDTDKLVQFVGDSWATINYQVRTGCADRKCRVPIFQTLSEDRGSGSGTTALFRTDNASALTIDLFVNGTGDVQICAMPIVMGSTTYEVDLSQSANCQTFTMTGDASIGMIFSETSADEHVITVELLTPVISTESVVCVRFKGKRCVQYGTRIDSTNPWMNITQVNLYNAIAGLAEGQYAQSFPGIRYNTDYVELVNETMETEDVNWDTIGGTTQSTRSAPSFNGVYSRKVVANIGQGIEFVDEDLNGIDLAADTYYTVNAYVYIDPTSVGDITMQLFDGGSNLTELDGLDLTTSAQGAWQKLRATFKTDAAYNDVLLRFVVGNGLTTFFLDDVTVTTGAVWETATAPLGPSVCYGSGKRRTCVAGDPLFDSVGGNMYVSSTPGASFNFTFVGTGFELGLLGGNHTGEVQVCYEKEGNVDPDAVNCFTYNQDDGVPALTTYCVRFKKGRCLQFGQSFKNTNNMLGRGIAGLESATWVVTVMDVDDGYANADSTQTRTTETVLGIDYVNIFNDTDVVSIPFGVYNEDATDGSDNPYLRTYPEDKWKVFAGTSQFTNNSYVAPADGSQEDPATGPIAMVQVEVTSTDEFWTVVFQLGLQSTNVSNNILICVDEANGKMVWNGTEYTLEDSDSCKIMNGVANDGQVSVSAAEIDALTEVGTHTVTLSSLSPVGLSKSVQVCVRFKKGRCIQYGTQLQPSDGNLRIDGMQIFSDTILTAGLYNEIMPDALLNFSPDVDSSDACDTAEGWCQTKTKTIIQTACVRFKKSRCIQYGPRATTTNPYIIGAAISGQEGATLNFTAQGTGFSIISDVWENGLDFRACYKLNTSDTAFPALDSTDEETALNGFDAEGFPVLVGEGAVLCEDLTTDTDNWDDVMDRPMSSGEQYGFSFYGLPFDTYDVQVMVTTPQGEISSDELFTLDAVQVFSDVQTADVLDAGFADNTDENIIYEPSLFWGHNTTTDTYMNTESVSSNAGSIAQFTIDGNSLVIYQRVGDMTNDVQICVLISNDNIHCSVEAERQTRIARQVASFTQYGELVPTTVCVRFKKGRCLAYGTRQYLENTPFTPVVFYGLGVDEEHTVILENRVHNKVFNLDAIRVIE